MNCIFDILFVCGAEGTSTLELVAVLLKLNRNPNQKEGYQLQQARIFDNLLKYFIKYAVHHRPSYRHCGLSQCFRTPQLCSRFISEDNGAFNNESTASQGDIQNTNIMIFSQI